MILATTGILAVLLLSIATVATAQYATETTDPFATDSMDDFFATDEPTATTMMEEPIAAQQDEPNAASSSCLENGMNVQCTDFGTIKMESRRDIRGEPIDVTAQIYLNTGYGNQGARWVMFSVRNTTDDGPSPITIGLNKFSTSSGDVVTTRVEQVKPSELNLWVDVLDLPLNMPISLDLRVGATERGAYSVETLVLAFDRGYAPVQDAYGNDASLFSFTLLGVNKETASTAGDVDTLSEGNKLPAPGLLAVLGVMASVAAIVVLRRRAK